MSRSTHAKAWRKRVQRDKARVVAMAALCGAPIDRIRLVGGGCVYRIRYRSPYDWGVTVFPSRYQAAAHWLQKEGVI